MATAAILDDFYEDESVKQAFEAAELARIATREALVREVHRGLLPRPRTLSPWIFYDEKGSALFERITQLPEYYPTRTERAIFSGYADGMIAAALSSDSTGKPLRVVELGAGTAAKTGILLDAAVRARGSVHYVPVDVSPSALAEAEASITRSLPEAMIEPVVANYVADPLQLPHYDGPTLALYIGSSIGNFTPAEARTILSNLRSQLHAGDALLLGTDLVKDQKTMISAYDDNDGVTAAFNLNMLRRLNKEAGADFDLPSFRHRAFWNAAESRIEMHLESLRQQLVRVHAASLAVRFDKGETIHTENSYKFTDASIGVLMSESGFAVEEQWKDERGWFAVTLGRI